MQERWTKGKEWHGEEERRMEGKMNSRWQSDNPGYDRSEYLPVRWRYTHRLHRNALIYRTSAMCRERRAPRAYLHTYICTNVYINASASLCERRDACTIHECVYRVARFNRVATFQRMIETKLFL